MLDGDGDAEESMLEFLFTEREDAGKARPKPKPVIQPKPPTSPGSKEGGGEVDRSSSGRAAGGKSVRRLKRRGAKRARRGTLRL